MEREDARIHPVPALDHRDLSARILDSIPMALVILGPDRSICYGNARFVRLIASDRGSFVGLRLGESLGCQRLQSGGVCGETPGCAHCGANLAIRAAVEIGLNETRECGLTVIRAGGVVALDLEVHAEPIRDDRDARAIVSLRDITDEKRRAALERIFFHDLLNAAGGIRGLIEVWGTLDANEIAEMLPHAQVLVDGILEEIYAQRALSAAERGDLEVHAETVELDSLLRSLAVLYRHHPAAQGKTLEVATGEGVIRTDPILLRRVLGNLVKNALEASLPGQRVTITAEAEPDPLFRVHNEDAMSEAVRFQVFQRSFTTKGPGRGLGTWGARLLVERYLGGRISFRSEPGTGTVFEVRLPIAEAVGRRAA